MSAMERERERKRKYSLKVKKIMSNLETTLVSLGGGTSRKTRTYRQILEDSLVMTRDLEDEMSQVLADIRTDKDSGVKNASLFTLTSVKAAFTRHLREAEQKSETLGITDEPAQDFLENYMEDAAKAYFSSLVREARTNGVATQDACNNEKQLLTSPSPSTSAATNGFSSPATPGGLKHHENGLFTPHQQNESELTPSVAKPKKQRGFSTPVSTPASSSLDVTPAEARNQRPSFCKKSLNFADESLSFSRKRKPIEKTSKTEYLKNPAKEVEEQTHEYPYAKPSGSGLPPVKRIRINPNLDLGISQDLLPLPVHCSAQLLMTPLSNLKNMSLLAADSEVTSKMRPLATVGGTGTNYVAKQMDLASTSDDNKIGTENLTDNKQNHIVIGQLGPFGCIKQMSGSMSISKQQNGHDFNVKLDPPDCDSTTSGNPSNHKEEDPFQINKFKNAVPSSPVLPYDETSGDSFFAVEDSPQVSSSISPHSPKYRPSPREGKCLDSSTSQGKAHLVTPEGKTLPGPSGYRFVTPKVKGNPSPGLSPSRFTPKRRYAQAASPTPSPSGIRVSTPRGNFIQKFSPMWRLYRHEVTTPENNFINVNAQAPRKKFLQAPNRRTPSCKRSLARQFAEISQTTGPFITPPRSPERINYYVPGIDTDSDE